MKSFVKPRITLLLAGLIYVGLGTGIVHAKVTVVACVGASNTEGWGLPASQAYPAQMEEILQRANGQWDVHNFGVSGNTVLRGGDKPYSTTRALALKPDIVIFHFGPNATRSPNRGLIDEHFVSDYVDLIGEFSRLRPVPKMWICLPTALHSTRFTASPTIMDNKVNPDIHDVAAITGLPIIDLFSVFKAAPDLYQNDDIHLTSAGATLMAEVVAAAMLDGLRWPPDFNGDSTVNIEDLIVLIETWGQSEPALDIAPSPFGDGIVDVQDLEVVMQYWGQDVNDPTLMAHWKLDEAEGDVAYDSAAKYDAVVLGDATWQPDMGHIDGALQFDGIDDYLAAPFVLDPVKQAFSVFAWIKGGQSGQAIISQQGAFGAWLSVDPTGALATGLTFPLPAATSDVVVTNDQWLRIGLVSDGSGMSLYVDDVEVARTDISPILPANGDLQIGTGTNLEPDTFWEGMIDDVRIYDRVVAP